MSTDLSKTIVQYKQDPESVYHTWFFNNEDRLKAFRTIKRGLVDVIYRIEQRTFGTDFKGSSLEVVVTAISEQKQVFEGAAHAFFWKPKLRIPDIYENDDNQIAFGRFLKACLKHRTRLRSLKQSSNLTSSTLKGLVLPWQTSCISCIQRSFLHSIQPS
jgi:type II restriction enzyme